jgi:polyphosphate glucokinase
VGSPAQPAVRAAGPEVGPATEAPIRFLTIDIGGSGLKAAVIDVEGSMLTERVRVPTPADLTPDELVDQLVRLVTPLQPFDRVSVGFPGVVKDGVVVTAPNLGTDRLAGLDLAATLERRLGCPVRVVNDAVIQGHAVVRGEGIELVLTLGTGFGAVIFNEGRPLPVFEMAHHPFRKGQTYEEQLGKRAFAHKGRKVWNRRLKKALAQLYALFRYDRVYLGGGNAKKIRFAVNRRTTIVSNQMGVRGGAALWDTPGAGERG